MNSKALQYFVPRVLNTPQSLQKGLASPHIKRHKEFRSFCAAYPMPEEIVHPRFPPVMLGSNKIVLNIHVSNKPRPDLVKWHWH